MTISHTAGAQPRRARFSTSQAALSGASLLAIASFLASAPAAQAQTITQAGNFTPAVHNTVDARGVDLITGAYHPPQQSVSIGDPDQGGMTQAFFGSGQRDNMTGTFELVGNSFSVTIGDKSETFTNGASDQKAGSSFVYNASTQTGVYTGRDGTVAQFVRSPGLFTLGGRISSLRKPNGETWAYHYKLVPAAGNYASYYRLQSVTNNFGYQIKYEYAQAGDGQYLVSGVHAVNNAIRYCDPDADLCGDLNAWPSLAFTGVQGVSGTVTDSLGRTTTTQFLGLSSSQTTYPGGQQISLTFTESAPNVSDFSLARPEGNYHYVISRDDSTPQKPVTTQVTDPGGHSTTVFARRDLGVITKYTDENGASISYEYYEDGSGRLKRATAPEGDAVEYDYDARGNVTATRRKPKPDHPNDPTLSATAVYESGCSNVFTCNQPQSITDENGQTTTYTYDIAHGGVTSISRPPVHLSDDPNETQHVSPVSHISYVQTRAQALDGATQLTWLDPVWRPESTWGCAGSDGCVSAQQSRLLLSYAGLNALPSASLSYRGDNTEVAETRFTYNSFGDLTAEDGPLSGSADTSTYVYNGAGRQLVGSIDPDPDGSGSERPRARRVGYALNGEVSLVEQGTVESAANWATFAPITYVQTDFDAAGRKAFERTGDTGQAPISLTQYGYDAASRLQCVTVRMNVATFGGTQPDACSLGQEGSEGADRITKLTYDDGGRLTAVTNGLSTSSQRDLRRYHYTADGFVDAETDGNGNVTSYRPDGLNRLQKISYPNPASGASSSGPYRLFGYDGAGRIASERLRNGGNTTTSRDGLGQVTARTVDGSRFTYDSFGRVLTANVAGVALTNTYDSRGNLLSQTGPLGMVSYEYDAADRRTKMTWPDGFYVTYEHDDASRLKFIRENGVLALVAFAWDGHDLPAGISRANGVSTLYNYGSGGRLSSLSHGAPGAAVTLQYGRNAAGQVNSRAANNGSYLATPTPTSAENYTSNGLNQYTSVNGAQLQHNPNGDTTADGQASYAYDDLDRLTQANGATLTYDAYGRLASEGSTRFLYDGDDLIAEVGPSNGVIRRYVHGPGVDQPLVAYEGASVQNRSWLLADERGSVVGSSNGSGATITTALDDYGRGQLLGRFGFTGQAWLSQAGVYHFKARAYSPKLGRFLQPDPSGDFESPSLYAYAGNDPVNSSDPSGLDECGYAGNPAGCIQPPDFRSPEIEVKGAKEASGLYTPLSIQQRLGGQSSISIIISPVTPKFGGLGLISESRMKGERGRAGSNKGTPRPDKHMKPVPGRPGFGQLKDPQTGKLSGPKPWPTDPRLGPQRSDYTPLVVLGTGIVVVGGIILAPELTIPGLIVGGMAGAH